MKNFAAHFKEKWYLYLALALVLTLAVVFVLDGVTAPTEKERVEVFFSCVSAKDELSLLLNERRPDNVRKVVFNAFNEEEAFYGTYFNTYGKRADVVTLSQKFADMCQCEAYFFPLTDAVKEQCAGAEFYFRDGKAYGVKIFDGATRTGIAEKYVQYAREGAEAQDCWLFFNKTSTHFDAASGGDGAALRLLELLWQL